MKHLQKQPLAPPSLAKKVGPMVVYICGAFKAWRSSAWHSTTIRYVKAKYQNGRADAAPCLTLRLGRQCVCVCVQSNAFIQLLTAQMDHGSCWGFLTSISCPHPAVFRKAMRRPAGKVRHPIPYSQWRSAVGQLVDWLVAGTLLFQSSQLHIILLHKTILLLCNHTHTSQNSARKLLQQLFLSSPSPPLFFLFLLFVFFFTPMY